MLQLFSYEDKYEYVNIKIYKLNETTAADEPLKCLSDNKYAPLSRRFTYSRDSVLRRLST